MRDLQYMTASEKYKMRDDTTRFEVRIFHYPNKRENEYELYRNDELVADGKCPKGYRPENIFRYHVREETEESTSQTAINKIKYMGYSFIPYGNIIGKDEQTRFQRLMWRTDTLSPLLNKTDGYDYYEFNKAAGAAADVYYCPETKGCYVPIRGGLCHIDVAETRKHIKLLGQDFNHLNSHFAWGANTADEADQAEANVENEEEMEV